MPNRANPQSAHTMVFCCTVTVWLLAAILLHPRLSAADTESTSLQNRQRVLFVGNSYTHFNMLPSMVKRLAHSISSTDRFYSQAYTKPGYTLQMHWRRGQALSLIKSGHFSHVVLQAHSLDPIDRPGQFTQYSEKFASLISRVNAQTILYETWARHPAHSIYRDHTKVHSSDDMLSQIETVFQSTSNRIGAQLAPVGTAFHQTMNTFPEITLLRPDGSHPSYSGSFLAACVIFGVITGLDPQDSSYHPYEVPSAEADRLKQIAAQVLTQMP